MYIKELLEQYEFHDSFIEDVIFENNRLELQIYLYNWETNKGTRSIRLIFKEIRNLIFDATEKKFDCDSILEFSCEDIILINEVCSKVKLLLDGDTNIKKIEFIAKEVEVIL